MSPSEEHLTVLQQKVCHSQRRMGETLSCHCQGPDLFHLFMHIFGVEPPLLFGDGAGV